MQDIKLSMSLDEFNKTYFYKYELINFCKKNHLPYQWVLKFDLEKIIQRFLQGEHIPIEPKIKKENTWVQDILWLESEVTDNYRSNQETRVFFESVIGKKFRFCGALMHYKKLHPQEYVTYQDLVNIRYQEQENKKNGISTTKEYYKANRYNEFVKEFYKDSKNIWKKRSEMIQARQQYKLSGKVNML